MSGRREITVSLPEELYAWLEQAAAAEFRSTENQAAWLLAKAGGQDREFGKPAAHALAAELRALHARAGKPTHRQIVLLSEQAGRRVSAGAVHGALTGENLPSMRVVEGIAAALGGDLAEFRALRAKAGGP